MSIAARILANTQNRQYPLPEKNWKYYQEWHKTIFFHWEVPVYFLEEYIPDGLELDLYQNMAWVSVVSFEVKNRTLRNMPAFPYLSNFEEINVRTYVTKNGIRGIYMFSIETNKLIEVLLSKLFAGLPYQKSEIKRSGDELRSSNKKLEHILDITIGAHAPILHKTALDLWLTERYALYEVCGTKLCRFDIHHAEWNLSNLDVTIRDICYDAGKYTINIYPDTIQYSEKIEVLFWDKIEV
ncbi:YqjF family protein [Flavobacterium gelatinilyticum]|uniref:YqjF family protein n=1 Tax=Flavobacterium gelatinilyticum TaxID=3003260 RepID=UPI00248158D1|nr:DUF2071 domain-containing protein [Flavobacterium gelatinilyticum]